MIKLIAVDMDGTLLNEHSRLNQATIDAVKQAKAHGIKVVLCTGRPLTGLRQFVGKLGLTEPGDYAVTYNGAMIQHVADGKVLAHHTLTLDDYKKIDALGHSHQVHVYAEDEANMYTSFPNISRYSVYEAFLVEMPLFYKTLDQFDADHMFSKVMFIEEPELLASAKPEFVAALAEDYNLVQSEPFFLEVLHKKASKGNAVAALAERLGYSMDQVMAIGDQNNDMSMLEVAGLPVAMGNAIPAVKAVAKVVTATNKEDGVAKAIMRYAINGEPV